jgi:ferredoxin-NADP reductase
MLGRHLDGVGNPIFYVAGPSGMVRASRTMLVASGVDEDDIRTEEFTGY